MKVRMALLLAAAMTAAFVSTSRAAITVFTNRAAWELAVGTFAEETFDDAALSGFSLNFVGPGHTPGAGLGVSGGELHDRLNDGGTTEINFDDPTLGFGANWDLAGPGGVGTGVSLFLLGDFVATQIPNTTGGTFFGIVSDVPFSQIVLHEGTQPGAAETYDADNFVFQTGPQAVPEPATLALALAGAGVLALRRRRA